MAKWFGSKGTSGLCQAIVASQPPHDVYIEPFLGGGAIMKRKLPAQRNIGIDLDQRAIDGFTCDYPVELHQGCAFGFLEAFPFQGGELVYCDPPYLQATRRSERRYRHDFDDAAHVALLDLLKSLDCQVMISGYPSRLYETHLADWQSLSLQVNNHAAVVTESIWFNSGAGPSFCRPRITHVPLESQLDSGGNPPSAKATASLGTGETKNLPEQ